MYKHEFSVTFSTVVQAEKRTSPGYVRRPAGGVLGGEVVRQVGVRKERETLSVCVCVCV